MDQIHILFLIDVLYGTHGGAEHVLWNMTRLLPRDRYRCSVATFATHSDLVAADQFDCPVYLFPIGRTYDWRALKTAWRLAALIRLERVSIVHTFFAASDLFGGTIARLSGCPILISSRRDMGYQRSATHRVAYRLAGGLFDQVHAVADQVRLCHIQQDGLDPKKVVTVYNGVDLDEIDRAPSEFRLADSGLENPSHWITCVANIRPVKALEELIATAAIVCRELPGARFIVAGAVQDTPYMQQLTELARRLNVQQHVIFVGSRPDVPSLLKMSDLFYLPSRSEGLSNAMLEAMACALPCVATDVGGNGELIQDAGNGYLVPYGDPAAAAHRILTLLRNPVLAREMGQSGRRIAESGFSVKAMIAKLTELYDGLVAGLADAGQIQSAAATERGLLRTVPDQAGRRQEL